MSERRERRGRIAAAAVLVACAGASVFGPAGGASAAAPRTNAPISYTTCGPQNSQVYETGLDTPWWYSQFPFAQLAALSTGPRVRVAIIDTGVDVTNPSLAGAVVGGYDYLRPSDKLGTIDLDSHGTEVAGIIAARPLNGTSVAGIDPNVDLLSYRQNSEHISAQIAGRPANLIDAIYRAVAAGANIINISQTIDSSLLTSDPGTVQRLEDALRYAAQKHVLTVVVAGNERATGNPVDFPAAFTAPNSFDPQPVSGLIAVGAVDWADQITNFSNSHSYVGVSAPGDEMTSTFPNAPDTNGVNAPPNADNGTTTPGPFCQNQGTSFAAPYVVGVAALMMGANPALRHDPDAVIKIIEATADRHDGGYSPSYGWGVVNPSDAVAAALRYPHESLPAMVGGGPECDQCGAKVPSPQPLVAAYHQVGESATAKTQQKWAWVGIGAAILLAGLVIVGGVVSKELRKRH